MRQKVIKFQKKNKPNSKIVHIIVRYKKKSRSKNLIFEIIGFLNKKRPYLFGINLMRLGYWLNKGAILNNTVKKYLAKLIYINIKYD